LFSKREDAKAIGKISIVPALFNINEPMIFGVPLVLNPIFAIPFIFGPVITAAVGYALTSIGFASPAFILLPWTTPPVINALLSTGSVQTVIAQIICIALLVVIYAPFVKVHNTMLAKEQNQNLEQNQSEQIELEDTIESLPLAD
jgi:cellobiose PTS system EIIC component